MAKSVFGGESFFLNTFTAGSGGLDLNGAIISGRHQNLESNLGQTYSCKVERF